MKINTQEGRTYFVCKKEKYEEIWQLSGTYISETTEAISFKLGMQGCVYGPTKIYKFDRVLPLRNRSSSVIMVTIFYS